jgi:hypothetical protein
MFDSVTTQPVVPDDRRPLIYAATVANTLVLLLLLYAFFGSRTPTLYWAFPVVWISVGTWAVFRTTPAPSNDRAKRAAAAIAIGYFLVLGFVGGLFGPSNGVDAGLTIQLTDLPPGWNPAILYTGGSLRFAFVPFKAFGYATLSYLVYATAIEAKGAVAGGLVGLFSCVSCTLPVIAALLSGLLGGGTALVAAASSQTYALGTVVFVVTVLLLSYRPGTAWLRERLQN